MKPTNAISVKNTMLLQAATNAMLASLLNTLKIVMLVIPLEIPVNLAKEVT